MQTTTTTENERDLSFDPVINPHPRRLTTDQIEFYNQNGYVRPLSIYGPEEAQRNREYFDWLLAEIQHMDDGRDAYSINSYQSKCRGLYDIVTEPRILDHVEDLLGPDFVCWGAHFFCKMPHDPKVVPWHQDASYWPFNKSRTVTVWLAIDDADIENGAMRFIPGTHRMGALRWKPTQQLAILDQEIEGIEEMGDPVVDELKAGEISLHADMLAHGSEANESERRRGGLTIRYCPTWVRAAHGWNQGSILVRGNDRDGNWANNPRPSGENISPLPHQLQQIKAG